MIGDERTDRSLAGQPAGPDLQAQVAALAEQVRRLGDRGDAVTAAAAPARREPLASRTGEIAVDVIAIAERAAAEIRESARREAARIASRRSDDEPSLPDVVSRQRHALAALAAEVERIEHSAEILREQVRLLDTELHRVHALLSGPGASCDTSRHPLG
jgi:cell division protein FtsB